MVDVVGTGASVIQLLNTSINLLGFACDFYDTHNRIDKAERDLKEDLKTLLQLCKDVDSFVRRYFQGRGVQPAGAPKKSQLLQMALESLVADVRVFNQKVNQLQVSRNRFSRTFRMMWNRAEWIELNVRITSHRLNIGLAFNMLSIDLERAEKFETRIAYKEASAKMTTIRKRQQSRQSQSQSQSHDRSQSKQRSTTPRQRNTALLNVDPDAFDNLAEQVFQDVSNAVGRNASSDRVSSLSTVPPQLWNPILTHLPEASSDQGPTHENQTSADRSPVADQVLQQTRDYAEGRLDRSALSEAAQEDRCQARRWLKAAEEESEYDDRVSRRGHTELEKARQYQENAIRRMSELQMKYRIGLPTDEIVDMWTVLAQINEIDNKKSDAIENLINLLGLELEETSSIRTKLKIARLSHDIENYDLAFNLAHKSYDAADSLWRQTSTGISEVIMSLELLISLHGEDATLTSVYTKRRKKFEAWNYISGKHSDFALYLHEYSESPLTYVASRGYDTDVVELLRMNPELILHRSASGATPLIAAAHEKHMLVVRALLEDYTATTQNAEAERHRVDVGEVDSHGDSALHAAQMPPSTTFDEQYADENWKDVAASVTELLLQHAADPSLTNSLGQSALHLAAEQENCVVMEQFLTRDRSLLNSKDCGGSTLLHVAIERGRFEMVEMLLDMGADSTIEDDEGRDALGLAKDPVLGTLRNDNIIKLLRRQRKVLNKPEGTSSASTVSSRGLSFRFWS